MLPVVMSGLPQQEMQMYSLGSSHQSTPFCVSSVWCWGWGGGGYSRWVSHVNGLTDLFRIG